MEKSVAIVSRESQSCYEWLIRFISTFIAKQNIQPIFISNNSSQNIRDEVDNCVFALLYHTKTRGSVNVTDVPDAQYDKVLKDLSYELGKRNVIVVIDDLDVGTGEAKNIILKNQPSIRALAQELLIFSTMEKLAYMGNISYAEALGSARKKLNSIKVLIQEKVLGVYTKLMETHNDTGHHQENHESRLPMVKEDNHTPGERDNVEVDDVALLPVERIIVIRPWYSLSGFRSMILFKKVTLILFFTVFITILIFIIVMMFKTL